MKQLFFTLLTVSIIQISVGAKMKLLYEWKYLDYNIWVNDEERESAVSNKSYVPYWNVPYDVQKVEDGRFFITVVRVTGVPLTLGTVSDKVGEGGPLIDPYPDMSYHLRNADDSYNCENIISVFRMKADSCNRLWAIDAGINGVTVVCPAKLLAFDLKTNKLVKRIEIPYSLYTNNSSAFDNIVLDIGGDCENIRALIADTNGNKLAIYNKGALWTVDSTSFDYESNAAEYTAYSKTYFMKNGILPVAIGQCPVTGKPRLYYNSVSSYKMYSVLVEDLLYTGTCKNATYVEITDDLPSRVLTTAISEGNIMFLGLYDKAAVACYNLKLSCTAENVVTIDQDNETLQSPFAVKVIGPPSASKLLVLSNRYERFRTVGYYLHKVNFRIFEGNVNELVEGTNCVSK